MYIVFISSFIALLLTYMESIGRLKNGMKWGFYIITSIAVIHYNYGSDYMEYYNLYNSLESVPWDFRAIVSGDYFRDAGWAILNMAFKYIGGFFMLVAVLNIIQNLIYYRFIRDNVRQDRWWLAMFIYTICTSYYVINFSMMRQGFTIAIFLACWPLIKEPIFKKNAIAAFIIFLASFCHHSAIIIIPFCFWSFIPMRNGRLVACAYVIFFILMWFSKDVLDSVLSLIFESELTEQYVETYGTSDAGFSGGLGFVLLLIPFIVCIMYLMDKNLEEQNKTLVSLSTISSMLMPICVAIPMAGRIGGYFSAFSIAAYPLVYYNIKNNTLRNILLGLYMFITLVDYYRFFFVDVSMSASYRHFHTIFEVLF